MQILRGATGVKTKGSAVSVGAIKRIGRVGKSSLFPDFLEARRQFLISQIVSLAIKEELDSYADDFSIKWPNDIYWKDKKYVGC